MIDRRMSDPVPSVTDAYDAERFRALGHALIDRLADYLDAARTGDDALQERVRARVVGDARFFLTRTVLDAGRVWLRCTILNPATKLDDLRALLDAIRAAA